MNMYKYIYIYICIYLGILWVTWFGFQQVRGPSLGFMPLGWRYFGVCIRPGPLFGEITNSECATTKLSLW